MSYPEETQRNKVAALLTEFADVFAHSADDMPRTSIVKYEIHAHESKPICQNPRGLPISQQAMAEAESVKSSTLHPAHGHPQFSWSIKRMGPPVSTWIIAGSILPQ